MYLNLEVKVVALKSTDCMAEEVTWYQINGFASNISVVEEIFDVMPQV